MLELSNELKQMEKSLSGKTILITGSTDGLGKLIATHLAMKDATVILHGRNESKGKQTLEQIKNQTKNEKLKYYNADYSSLHEVNSISEEIIQTEKRIDVLINNAAIGMGAEKGKKREVSEDGIEMHFQVNYLAHVLLTEKLLPILRSADSNIINVASVGQATIDFQDVMLEKNYDGFLAYRKSKTAIIMYTFDLAERLKDKGIKVNAVHPASLMNTKMVVEYWGYSQSTVEEGANAVENLLSANTTGQYYDGKQLSKAIAQTYDKEARTKLRHITDKILKNFFIFSQPQLKE